MRLTLNRDIPDASRLDLGSRVDVTVRGALGGEPRVVAVRAQLLPGVALLGASITEGVVAFDFPDHRTERREIHALWGHLREIVRVARAAEGEAFGETSGVSDAVVEVAARVNGTEVLRLAAPVSRLVAIPALASLLDSLASALAQAHPTVAPAFEALRA